MEAADIGCRCADWSKGARSTVLSIEDEAVVVAFCRHTLLPLPHLTRSSLHRCLQRHGISRLPEVDGDKPDKGKFKSYPVGLAVRR